jgi:ASC-1-like (ASCH) protein
MQHIAIMRKSWGLTRKILMHHKTIESRWYKTRAAPWDRIKAGETIYFKDSGAPVTLKATVADVLQFSVLTPAKVRELLERYGPDDGLSRSDIPLYYNRFKDSRYCLLIFLKDAEPIAPFNINKQGYGTMSAWLTIPSIDDLRIPES